ncbi:MAG: ribosomal RNA small subunit methyltransferase A [Candidatus Buchananbacteria bacterium RIFCSPLOWO2_01_FULL_46_12]|uniref:Ribosomal RNA small subunit methyltransferase A n=2 Tax=Candidatus Buchananiibacteriota TaxID=1817903 RepID=A0A1G1YMF1_9BACT|nr:MAG: ribosomal RNA small subunit methyltransferase A [Candidatus Buchananbacteria bacterium RIFCSPHIGHO2_01_FULL_44_11]OGY53535.1 MAG: ribosomal RNA small subunit methyltransferase A [Candidatus Buchananbacteria bacterium RIFCSPLOWO2_01_FULL_46_12]
MITNLEKIKNLCRLYDLKPQPSKGQNFLFSSEVIEKIVNAAEIKNTDIILEVGPGLGILTEGLVATGAKVLSVELDKKLFEFLKVKFNGVKNLKLVQDDVLNFQPVTYGLSAYKIVANLPYNITSIFLRQFLTTKPKPATMTILVQKEVAQRICASPGQLNLLAISVQLYGQPQIVDLVKRDNFWPAPAVDSAILKIDQIKDWSGLSDLAGAVTEKEFWRLVKIGFSAKRKQLANNLAAGLNFDRAKIQSMLRTLNLNDKIRAQDLAIVDWFRLAKNLKSYFN